MSGDGKDLRGLAVRMALHAALAGAFFFVFQRYGMQASLETSLVWAAALAAGAAFLAWQQSGR